MKTDDITGAEAESEATRKMAAKLREIAEAIEADEIIVLKAES